MLLPRLTLAMARRRGTTVALRVLSHARPSAAATPPASAAKIAARLRGTAAAASVAPTPATPNRTLVGTPPIPLRRAAPTDPVHPPGEEAQCSPTQKDQRWIGCTGSVTTVKNLMTDNIRFTMYPDGRWTVDYKTRNAGLSPVNFAYRIVVRTRGDKEELFELTVPLIGPISPESSWLKGQNQGLSAKVQSLFEGLHADWQNLPEERIFLVEITARVLDLAPENEASPSSLLGSRR